jgi:sarcosine oxidase, subunit alpha
MRRIGRGRWVDTSEAVPFEFDGRRLVGARGDTVGSALLANGVRIVARSFKRHRPRGIVAAGTEESNAYVRTQAGDHVEANALATVAELVPGMRVQSLHAWPNAAWDVGAVAERFAALMPAGFYYKTFIWPGWKLYEPAIRRAAGLDRVPEAAPAYRGLARYAHCDVLVVGGGPAGLAAAGSCADAGLRVVLVEGREAFGGWPRWASSPDEEAGTQAWIEARLGELRGNPRVRLLTRTLAMGYYDHNLVAAIETFPQARRGGGHPDQRLWQFRARQVILATGAVERPLVFPNNDLPGVMLASAGREYLHGYGVAVASRAVFFTNNDSAYLAAVDMKRAGVEVAAIVDCREGPAPEWSKLAAELGIEIAAASHVSGALGGSALRAIEVSGNAGGRAARRIECDALLVSGGWTPQVQLHAHCGGKLRFDADTASFVPDSHALGCLAAGAINGLSLAEAIAADAARAASEARVRLGGAPARPIPALPCRAAGSGVAPWWSTPGNTRKNHAWVDLHSDVTEADVEIAVRENYASVEHLKRYTTLGMGPDQGRTSNVNGLALLSQALGTPIAQTGTTRFRPPLVGASLATLAASTHGELYSPKRLMPAHARHLELGAHLQDYSGWQRPAHYARDAAMREAAIEAECRAVRTRAGFFDSSPLGKLEVRGPDAEEFLSRIYANGIRSLKPGAVRYGLMLLESGYLLDDGVVARLGSEHFLVGPSSGAAQRVLAWMEEWLQCEWPRLRVAIVDVTGAWASFSIAGPAARRILEDTPTDIALSPGEFPHMAFREGRVAGARARVQRVSFSGELQYEISVPASEALGVMDALMAAGRTSGLISVGLDAWLRLRIDKGYLHLGTDTDGTTTPDDVGLAGLYARKTEDFIGRRSLARPALVATGREQLVGLRVDTGPALAVGACIVPDGAGRFPCDIVGRVTSSGHSVALDRPVALARLRDGHRRIGETVGVLDARGLRRAEVCGSVFYDPEGARLRA